MNAVMKTLSLTVFLSARQVFTLALVPVTPLADTAICHNRRGAR
jgi:hypothetical protein